MLKRVSLWAMALIMATAACAVAVETKDIRFTFKNAEPVVFSHEFHLSRYNNNCKICHDAIFNLRNRRHFTMAEMEKTKSCGACHSGVKAFSVASEKDCVRCHKGKPRDITYRVSGFGEATFSHATHIAKTGGACKSCHNGKVLTGKDKGVTMAQMEKGRTCGACHNGKRAFTVTANCDRCHKGGKPKEITFNLKGVAPATFSHSFHLEAYKCSDCHTKVFPYRTVVGKATMADMAKGKSCGTCHNGKEAFSSNGDCVKCHKGLKPGTITFKTDAGVATFSHEFHLQAYKCADCHTKIFPYKAGASKATMADMEQGKSCGACHNKGKDAFPVQDDCGKCHKM
ncbi:cytochrome c3 family protein [Geobacter sp. SVR]|uniref:cytochrome c3 family protein n=1 Tax=Geobacter sp. SVR TaxID=2495594 RepID=UPI00143EF5B2|nr:cytochrome c3 family protein [Geobacter sp. SVR]BCS53028.1 cytochrome c [Geobacter sp. SVR]GCF84413.1 cytochrome c [Geobacter sp. SVR]